MSKRNMRNLLARGPVVIDGHTHAGTDPVSYLSQADPYALSIEDHVIRMNASKSVFPAVVWSFAARTENEDHLLALQNKERSLIQELRSRGDEERKLAREIGKANGNTPAVAESLSRLQTRMRESHQRATAARNDIIDISSQLVSEREMRLAFSLFDPVWDSLTPRERTRAMRLIVERVGYDSREGSVSIQFQPTGIRSLAEEVVGSETSCNEIKKGR